MTIRLDSLTSRLLRNLLVFSGFLLLGKGKVLILCIKMIKRFPVKAWSGKLGNMS